MNGAEAVTPESQFRARIEAVARAARVFLELLPAGCPEELRELVVFTLRTLEREEAHIAVAGLFKAGKSTLINRLARWDILPSGDLPETGAPALLRLLNAPASQSV